MFNEEVAPGLELIVWAIIGPLMITLILWTIYKVLRSDRTVSEKIVWILVICLLPIVGLVLFHRCFWKQKK